MVAVVTGIGQTLIKGYSGRSCYKEWAKVVIKGYSGSSYYSVLKNVLVKHYNFRCNISDIISFYKNDILYSQFCILLNILLYKYIYCDLKIF